MEIAKRSLRLDDEVMAAIELLPGRSVNDKLRALLVDGSSAPAGDSPAVLETLELVRQLPDAEDIEQIVDAVMTRKIEERQQSRPAGNGYDPRSVSGVQVGGELPKNARCIHCGEKFTGSKFATLCPGCEAGEHRGDPRECSPCTAGGSI